MSKLDQILTICTLYVVLLGCVCVFLNFLPVWVHWFFEIVAHFVAHYGPRRFWEDFGVPESSENPTNAPKPPTQAGKEVCTLQKGGKAYQTKKRLLKTMLNCRRYEVLKTKNSLIAESVCVCLLVYIPKQRKNRHNSPKLPSFWGIFCTIASLTMTNICAKFWLQRICSSEVVGG